MLRQHWVPALVVLISDLHNACDAAVYSEEVTCRDGCTYFVDGGDEFELLSLLQTSAHFTSAGALLSLPGDALKAKRMYAKNVTSTVSTNTLLGLETQTRGLESFFCSLITNFIVAGVCLMFFCFARVNKLCRVVYSGNVYAAKQDLDLQAFLPASTEPSGEETPLGWFRATRGLNADDCILNCGLDQWMLLEFCSMVMKIMAALALPNVVLLVPLHIFAGNHRACPRDEHGVIEWTQCDNLSRQGMANIEDGSHLYWIHAAVVWVSIFIVENIIYATMYRFQKWRSEWLESMSAPRCNTILVEGLPKEQRSDERLKRHFEHLFDSKHVVKDAICIKKTIGLSNDMDLLKVKEQALMEKMIVFADGEDVAMAHASEKLDKFEKDISKLRDRIEANKRQILACAGDDVDPAGEIPQHVCDAHSACGFITFADRRDAQIALRLTYSENAETFKVSIPPDPADVIYTDLVVDDSRESSEFVGWSLLVGVFLGYLPIIVGISSMANLSALSGKVPAFANIITKSPGLAAMWNGLVGTLALNFVISFLPTFLMNIFGLFFALKARAWLQYKVQVWYYWFQFIFVLCITCLGVSLFPTVDELIESPTSIFKLLASSLPTTAHFYLNLYPCVCTTHSMALMRLVPLSKYLHFLKLAKKKHNLDESAEVELELEARAKAEPEDQDYCGVGSRSARFTMFAVIGIVFCTLSPLITILCFVHFALCRMYYGYLFNWAETVKPDLGGVFFVQMLKHVQQGLIVYVIVMSAVLYYRGYDCPKNYTLTDQCTGPGFLPGLIALLSLTIVIPKINRFDRTFRWVDLPFSNVTQEHEPSLKHRPALRNTYQQPELM